MLTPTDVHILVGYLTLLSGEDNVELELGSQVFDVATETARDVDITVTVRGENGQITVIKGIEVKRERRKLDSPMIEQLCAKFSDMPEITSKVIVSASGYTEPARKKARYHNTQLLELRTWDAGSVEFPHMALFAGFSVSEQKYSWRNSVAIDFNPDQILPSDINTYLQSENPEIVSEGGIKTRNGLRILDLNTSILKSAQETLGKLLDSNSIALDSPVVISVSFEEPIWVAYGNSLVKLYKVNVEGTPTTVFSRSEYTSKILVDDKDQPLAAAVVSLHSSGSLVALSSSCRNRGLDAFIIPISLRNVEKIKQIRL